MSYDFQSKTKITHAKPRDLETCLQQQLKADDLETLKRGLANVLFWGHYTGPGRNRWKTFVKNVPERRLKDAKIVLNELSGTGINELKGLCLPEFSGLSFSSKLRMFLDPTQYVVLDLQLAKLANSQTKTLFHRLRLNRPLDQKPTSIPVYPTNVCTYKEWCSLCAKTANKEFPGKEGEEPIIAVDVERGIFHLAQENPEKAAALVAAIERCYLSPGA